MENDTIWFDIAWTLFALTALIAGIGLFLLYRQVRWQREMTERAQAYAETLAIARVTNSVRRGPEPLADILAPVSDGVPAGKLVCPGCHGIGFQIGLPWTNGEHGACDTCGGSGLITDTSADEPAPTRG